MKESNRTNLRLTELERLTDALSEVIEQNSLGE